MKEFGERPTTTIVELSGTIPVTLYVCVDEGDCHVQRVVAHDEEFKYDAPTETSEEEADVAALRGTALAVAETMEWPAWDWGH